MKWYAWLIVAAISLPNLACMHAEFFTGARAGKTKTLNNPFFLFGLVGENTFDTSKYCPRGVAAVDSYESFGDGFLSVSTIGIYTPRSLEITCAADANGVRHLLLGVDGQGEWRLVASTTSASRPKTLGAKSPKSSLEMLP